VQQTVTATCVGAHQVHHSRVRAGDVAPPVPMVPTGTCPWGRAIETRRTDRALPSRTQADVLAARRTPSRATGPRRPSVLTVRDLGPCDPGRVR
jgi:hypothetical protein